MELNITIVDSQVAYGTTLNLLILSELTINPTSNETMIAEIEVCLVIKVFIITHFIMIKKITLLLIIVFLLVLWKSYAQSDSMDLFDKSIAEERYCGKNPQWIMGMWWWQCPGGIELIIEKISKLCEQKIEKYTRCVEENKLKIEAEIKNNAQLINQIELESKRDSLNDPTSKAYEMKWNTVKGIKQNIPIFKILGYWIILLICWMLLKNLYRLRKKINDIKLVIQRKQIVWTFSFLSIIIIILSLVSLKLVYGNSSREIMNWFLIETLAEDELFSQSETQKLSASLDFAFNNVTWRKFLIYLSINWGIFLWINIENKKIDVITKKRENKPNQIKGLKNKLILRCA